MRNEGQQHALALAHQLESQNDGCGWRIGVRSVEGSQNNSSKQHHLHFSDYRTWTLQKLSHNLGF